MWWMYFEWQWLRDPYGTAPRGLQGLLAGVYLLLGIAGGYVHFKRDRYSFYFFGPLMFTITLALIFYMNFKYGYSQSPELGNSVPREVRDRDYFYLWGFSAWSVWAGLGIVLVWDQLASLLAPAANGDRGAHPAQGVADDRRPYSCSRSFRSSRTGIPRRGTATRSRATGPPIFSTASSRTAC